MLNFPYITMFLFLMITGTFFSLSSSHWFGVWMGLELNLMGIIPIMLQKGGSKETESAIKYFIIQASGSALFLFSIMLMSWSLLSWNLNFFHSYNISILLIFSLILKMGSAPLHFWVPGVMAGLSWFSNFLLLTWQKITPLLVITTFTQFSNNLLLFFIFFSSMIGGIGGINQTSLRNLIAYSSIAHTGWLLSAASTGLKICMLYFSIYALIILFMSSLLMKEEMKNMSNLSNVFSWDPSSRLYLILILFSLSGLPPFLGFFSKWFVIINLTNLSNLLIPFILIIGSLITLYYYLILSFSLLLSQPIFYMMKDTISYSMWKMISLNLIGLSMIFWFMTF
uniref:NADH-ubiquinone oxidoreductase chain 2 n=1 Tax=Nuttallina californica TaxID=413430 RepID=A0A0E3DE78_9MOLL|nr:NADH dehydrogenase subunit 2 [Nuttallina californica]AIA77077.1 NADH dehydrogenase subunit 2 [Nuttallina californica]